MLAFGTRPEAIKMALHTAFRGILYAYQSIRSLFSQSTGCGIFVVHGTRYDAIRVMIRRIRLHRNPFMPDKTHIHYKFLALGMSHRTAMVTTLFVSAFFALLNLGLMSLLNINLIVLLDVVLWTLMHIWLSKMIREKKFCNED